MSNLTDNQSPTEKKAQQHAINSNRGILKIKWKPLIKTTFPGGNGRKKAVHLGGGRPKYQFA
jgi:hypothetical protein